MEQPADVHVDVIGQPFLVAAFPEMLGAGLDGDVVGPAAVEDNEHVGVLAVSILRVPAGLYPHSFCSRARTVSTTGAPLTACRTKAGSSGPALVLSNKGNRFGGKNRQSWAVL